MSAPDGAAGAGDAVGSAEAAEAAVPAAPRQRSRLRRALGHPLAHLVAAILVIALVQAFAVKLFMVPSGSMEQTLDVGDRILVNRLAGEPQNGDVIVFATDDALWPRTDAGSGGGALSGVKYAAKWVFGDLLGFGPTTAHTMVKRVIGTAGQTVACCDAQGRLTVDGVPLDEPYIFEDPAFVPGELDCDTTPASSRCFAPVTVPEGMLLVLGDHRGASSDGILPCRGVPAGAGTGAEASEADDAGGSADGCARWVRVSDVYGEVFAIIWPLNRFGGLPAGEGER